MSRATWITLTVCGVTLAAATFALGGFRHGDGRGPIGRMRFERLAVRLKLTPEQESQIKAQLRQTRSAVKPQIDSLRNLRSSLAKQIFTNQPNQAEIQKTSEQLKQQLTAVIDQYVNAGIKINSVLSPEQRTEMQKVISEHQQLAERRRARQEQRRARHQDAGQPAKPQPAE